MAGCCDPKAPKVLKLNIGGRQIGLIGIQEAFEEVQNLNAADGITDDEIAGELLNRVKKKNYIPGSVEAEYLEALLKEYKKFLVINKEKEKDLVKSNFEGEVTTMQIKVLGPGCKKCQSLKEAVKEVVDEMGVDAEIIEVTDVNEISNYDVLMTPGLVVNEKVKVFGRVPKKKDIKKYIADEM